MATHGEELRSNAISTTSSSKTPATRCRLRRALKRSRARSESNGSSSGGERISFKSSSQKLGKQARRRLRSRGDDGRRGWEGEYARGRRTKWAENWIPEDELAGQVALDSGLCASCGTDRRGRNEEREEGEELSRFDERGGMERTATPISQQSQSAFFPTSPPPALRTPLNTSQRRQNEHRRSCAEEQC